MITKQDSLKLQKDFEKIFATKDELREFKEEFRTFKNNFYDKMDIVIGELKAIREEQTVGGHRQAKHSDKLENHDTRIGKLETAVFPQA